MKQMATQLMGKMMSGGAGVDGSGAAVAGDDAGGLANLMNM